MSDRYFYYPRFGVYERVARVDGNKIHMTNGVVYQMRLINRLKKKKLLKEYHKCKRKL